MALAEVRAAWQRTANRCLVQEDAKRAPRLACCSSVPPSIKQTDTEPTIAPGGQDIPSTEPPPFSGNPSSYSNLSPNSRWWLHLQPNYGFQKGIMDEQFNCPEVNLETYDSSGMPTRSKEYCGIIDQTTYFESSSDDHSVNFATSDKKYFVNKEEQSVKEDARELSAESFDVSKKSNEIYLDSESSWIEAEKNTPWWRTADSEELALLVAQRSLDLIENCDLPRPQNSRLKKDLNGNICCFGPDEIYPSSLDSKPFTAQACSPTTGNACPKLTMLVEARPASAADRLLRDNRAHEKMTDVHLFENDASKAQLMEALRHSQTRAREAEKVARQACAEKEHVFKLVFRQASQLFAYKQWLQLLQLENMYFQFKTNNKNPFPVMLHGTPQRSRKMRKTGQNSPRRKRAKRYHHQYDVGKYAVVFALGLGLVGAGLLLGWTVGWMLPAW